MKRVAFCFLIYKVLGTQLTCRMELELEGTLTLQGSVTDYQIMGTIPPWCLRPLHYDLTLFPRGGDHFPTL